MPVTPGARAAGLFGGLSDDCVTELYQQISQGVTAAVTHGPAAGFSFVRWSGYVDDLADLRADLDHELRGRVRARRE